MRKDVVVIFLCLLFVSACKKEQRPEEYYGEKSDPSLQGRVTVHIANRGATEVIYETYDSLDIIDGDIIINDRSVSKHILGNIEPGKTWARGVIPYTIKSNVPDNIKKNIAEAIDHWQKVTRLRFIPRSTETAYVTFSRGKSATIGSSMVGCSGTQQFIYLGKSTSTAVAIHEIGHSVGLWHEQSRPDRDQFVKIIWSNIRKRNQFNFRLNGTSSGPYDFRSRMHYRADAFSRDGGPTIIPVNVTDTIKNNGFLSAGDTIAISKLYMNR